MAAPTLAPNSTWFTQGGTSVKRTSIEKIVIVDTIDAYSKGSATVVDEWDASADNSGSVTAYALSDNTLVIAGNGSGKVYANADSSYAFSASDSNRFSNVTTIEGAALLDTTNATNFNRMLYLCKNLVSVDVSNWNTGNVTNMNGVFNQAYVLKEAAVENWDTSACTDMSYMFQLARGLTTLDLSRWNVGNVKTMASMFMGHSSVGPMNITSIGNVSNWDVSKVENMSGMFQLCTSLKSLDTSGWRTRACTDMSHMFRLCSALATIGDTTNWATGTVTNMSHMFRGCTSLEELDVSNWDVSKVTTMLAMFNSNDDYGETPMIIKDLDVSAWNPASCTDMGFMFYGCKGPGSIDVSGWNVRKVTNFDHMFSHSYLAVGDTGGWRNSVVTNLECAFHSVQNAELDVSGFTNTSNCISFSGMFKRCTKLTRIVGLETFNTSAAVDFSGMFCNCDKLAELDLSSFDTRNAKDGVATSTNGTISATMQDMFLGMTSLKKITLGKNFSFKGDGSTTDSSHHAYLPTPSVDSIAGAEGYWFTENGTAYTPDELIDAHSGVATYYAANPAPLLLVEARKLRELADAVRAQKGLAGKTTLDELILVLKQDKEVQR